MPRRDFYTHMLCHFLGTFSLTFLLLGIGVIVYHFVVVLSLVGSLLKASMILTGMGLSITLNNPRLTKMRKIQTPYLLCDEACVCVQTDLETFADNPAPTCIGKPDCYNFSWRRGYSMQRFHRKLIENGYKIGLQSSHY